MPDAAPLNDSRCGSRRVVLCSVLAFLLFWLCPSPPLQAAEAVQVIVSGVEGDALKNVRETLQLPAGLVRDGKVDQLWLERFAQQARTAAGTALEPFGYYRSHVTVSTETDDDGYRLLIHVVPGEAVRLAEVKLALTGPGSRERRLLRLIETFPLVKGDVLLHQSYEEAKAALKAQALDLGYLDADFSRHEIRVDSTATSATLALTLETGPRYYFGVTQIQGAPEFPQSYLGRHLTYQEGQPFSYARLGETQRNLANSERFKTVMITPEKQAAENFRIPITIQLNAGPRITLRPGIGYGTDTGARFTARYRDLNLFHQGHEFYSHLYIAEMLQGVVSGYIIPSPKDIRSSTTLQLNLQQEDTNIYSSRILALQLDRNRSLGRGKLGSGYLKLQYEDYSVGDQKSFSRLVLPGLRFSDNRFGNPIRPRRGFRYALDLHGTHQLLGSDTALVQIQAEGRHLQRLPGRFVLHTRAKTGLTFLNDPLRDIPPSLRFFTGGDQSVRGYSYQSLGPRDASGKVAGGKQLLTYSVELERAIFEDWGISAFYDAGNAFNSLSNIKLFHGAGLGLHYYSSVGALNLSVATPLGGDKPSLHIHFTVGFEL